LWCYVLLATAPMVSVRGGEPVCTHAMLTYPTEARRGGDAPHTRHCSHSDS
jgi:hypothetical protein